MNRDEAKQILLLYRPGTADDGDPQIAGALALARNDPELARWLEEQLARQTAVRAKFQEIPVPAGLKEQIISEQRAAERRTSRRRKTLAAATALAGMFVLLVWLLPARPTDNTFAIYRSRMISSALRGYAMDLATNNPAAIRRYLAQRQAPANYDLPLALQKREVAGCAVQRWQGANVSMICFRTGRPLPPGQQSDLWLFIVDRNSMRDAPGNTATQLAPVNRLMTASWTEGGKLYLLGTAGDEQAIRQYL
jgi:hypothetical protein